MWLVGGRYVMKGKFSECNLTASRLPAGLVYFKNYIIS